jgi:hypothetical protein
MGASAFLLAASLGAPTSTVFVAAAAALALALVVVGRMVR